MSNTNDDPATLATAHAVRLGAHERLACGTHETLTSELSYGDLNDLARAGTAA
jgi:hypothetical protein